MSTAKRIEVVDVVLTLTEVEARWLKAALQNPLVNNEQPDESAIRGAIWHALDSVL